jgi:hypothetical protein
MRDSRRIPSSITILIGLLLAATLLIPTRVWAQAAPQAAHQPTRAEWRRSMVKTPTESGCFKASYPSTTWEEVACSPAAPVPYIATHGTRPATVGDGTDSLATVTSGTISSSEGSFPLVSNVTSENEIDPQNNGPGSNVLGPNIFSLQLNTQFFTTTACNGGTAYCQGWVQFLYSSNTSYGVLIEYSLLYYTNSSDGCPPGWTPYKTPISGQSYYTCFFNTPVTSVPGQSVTNLSELSLTGNVTANGNDDVILSTNGALYKLSYADSTLNLAGAWTESEFNVFGDCCGYEASFNTGATLIVSTTVDNGTTNAASCGSGGYTGETNSLSLVPPCCAYGGASPGVAFMESSVTGMTPNCSYLEHPYAWLAPVSNLLLLQQ